MVLALRKLEDAFYASKIGLLYQISSNGQSQKVVNLFAFTETAAISTDD